MLKKISNFLSKISSTSMVTLCVIIALVFIAFVLPNFNNMIDTVSSGMGMPDKLFYYDAEKLRQIVQAYTAEGRRVYIRCIVTYDLAWPLVYIGFLCIAISRLNNYSFKPDSRFKLLNLIPLICALFDALENLSLSIVMLTFPGTMEILLNMAGIFTAGKWISVGLSVSMLGLSIVHAIRYGFHKGP